MSSTLKIPLFPTPREESSSPPLTSAYSFPMILYQMLDDAELHGFDRIVSWRSDGASFRVHHVPSFIELVAPRYFSLQKWTSFQKQCNLYGLHRVTKGANRGVYFHPHLLRGQPHLASLIKRKRKPTRVATAARPPQLGSSSKNHHYQQPFSFKSKTHPSFDHLFGTVFRPQGEPSFGMSSVTSSRHCNEEENGKIVFLPKSDDLAATLRDIDHYQGLFSSQDKKQEPVHIEPPTTLSCDDDDSVGTFTVEADDQEEEDESSPPMMTSTAASSDPFSKAMSFSFADLEPRPL